MQVDDFDGGETLPNVSTWNWLSLSYRFIWMKGYAHPIALSFDSLQEYVSVDF